MPLVQSADPLRQHPTGSQPLSFQPISITPSQQPKPSSPIAFSIGVNKQETIRQQETSLEQSAVVPAPVDEEDEDWDTAQWEIADSSDFGTSQQSSTLSSETDQDSSSINKKVTNKSAEAVTLQQPSNDTSRHLEVIPDSAIAPPFPGPSVASIVRSAPPTLRAPAILSRTDVPVPNRRFVVVEKQSDLYDDEEDLTIENLSDLEDIEPECSDLVVSQFEHVRYGTMMYSLTDVNSFPLSPPSTVMHLVCM